MNNKERQEQPIDPILIEKLNLIGATPDRNPEMAAAGRERFLAELESLPAASSPVSSGWLAGLFGFRNQRGNTVRIFNQKFALSTVFGLVLVAIMLFGGASATAYASQTSLPGDALYPIKMSLEQTQISLANDAYVQAKLHLEFAQRRLDEIKQLLAQGRSSDVEFASAEFESFIQLAMEATNTVMASDPERGAELSNLVSKALLDYAISLKAVLLEAPDPVKPVVEKALLFSQGGAGDEIEIFGVVESLSAVEIWIEGERYSISDLTEFKEEIAVGDTVKVHAILTPEGVMVVREIELAVSDDVPELGDDIDNENESVPEENENSNDNDNNGNLNESNENESENNTNDDDSDDEKNDNQSNENENEDDSNENMNENESEDDEVETKSEDNQNVNNSGDNENHSDDDENKSEENENDNSNESEEEEKEEEHNDNGY